MDNAETTGHIAEMATNAVVTTLGYFMDILKSDVMLELPRENSVWSECVRVNWGLRTWASLIAIFTDIDPSV